MFGCGLLQALLLARLLPWIRQQPFAASYWAFSFGVAAALPLGALRMLERSETGLVAVPAAPLFIGANLIVATLGVATLRLLLQGCLLPEPPAVAAGGSGA